MREVVLAWPPTMETSEEVDVGASVDTQVLGVFISGTPVVEMDELAYRNHGTDRGFPPSFIPRNWGTLKNRVWARLCAMIIWDVNPDRFLLSGKGSVDWMGCVA